MFKKWFIKKIENLEDRELEDFVSRLRYQDGESLGGAVASTANWADTFARKSNLDLYWPYLVSEVDPKAILSFGNTVRELQRQGEFASAIGGLVWVHTLRATKNGHLIKGVREIWKHLERGFPHAQDVADLHGWGHVRHVGRFPEGFTPEPK